MHLFNSEPALLCAKPDVLSEDNKHVSSAYHQHNI